ncbi:MAG: hypothetical protein ACYDCM_07275 [Candidatus Acidiferrales bacterium]
MKIDTGSLNPISNNIPSNLTDLFPTVAGLETFSFDDPSGSEQVSAGSTVTKREAFIKDLGLPEGSTEPAVRTAIRRFVEAAQAQPFSCEVDPENEYAIDVRLAVSGTNTLRDKKQPLLRYRDWQITDTPYRQSLRLAFEDRLSNALRGFYGTPQDQVTKFIEELRAGVAAPIANPALNFREQVSRMSGSQIHESYRKDQNNFRVRYDELMKQVSKDAAP